MGAAAVRITPENFLTPPEFRNVPLAGRLAGQIGGVRLELVTAGDKTRLGTCYQQIPLRVLPPFHFASEPAALLYLINPTVGLLDGDAHLIEITAGAGTRCVVTGQSASRIHPAVAGFATQQWKIRVESGAQLVILPGPVIPFRGCRYYQKAVIHLEAGARLIWGDLWLPGRYARGELSEYFQFERLVQDLEVWRERRLVYRDRFSWQGPWNSEQVSWHFGEGLAAGALFVSGAFDGPPPAGETQVDMAVLPLAAGDTCVRWCGQPDAVMRGAVRSALAQAATWSGGSWETPWLLHSHNFAPNHWFSSVAF